MVDALVELGFNRNEGKAYAALVELGAATGYEVAQRSGVPRSAVYSVLRRLAERGAVRTIPGSPERFAATPADALSSLLARRFSASEQALQAAVREVEAAPGDPQAFSVDGYERVLEEAARIAGKALHSLVISGWSRELAALAPEVSNARGRGVHVVVFSHTAIPEELAGTHFSYGLDEADLQQFWEHRLVLVADRARTVLGTTDGGQRDGAVVSEQPSVAEFAVGHVALDISLFAQRHGYDASHVMAQLLGERVGRLDELLVAAPAPVLGAER